MLTSLVYSIDEEQGRGRSRVRLDEKPEEIAPSDLSQSESNLKEGVSSYIQPTSALRKACQWPKDKIILAYISQPRRIIRQVKTAIALTIAIFLGTRYAPWFGKYPFLFGTIVCCLLILIVLYCIYTNNCARQSIFFLSKHGVARSSLQWSAWQASYLV